MALIMRPQDIDETFPVAGQDNESAGFRDNFTAIKDSLEYTNDHINTLTSSTVKLSERNLFDTNATLETVLLVAHSEKTMASSQAIVNPIGQEISYENGAYHSVVLGTPTSGNRINLDITGFPAVAGEEGRYAKIRLDAKLAAISTPAVILEFSNAAGALIYDGGWPVALSVTSYQHPISVEFWSYDGGNTVFAKYLGSYGETTRTTTLENLTVSGNATMGNSSVNDVITFTGIPKLPKLNNNNLTSIAGTSASKLGMIIYNTDNNKVQVFAITNTNPLTYGWVNLIQ
jgi:hypothetical protein